MRRSLAVKLTLLPMLASAAAAAQPAGNDEPPLQPPGASEPMLSPPGLSPPGLTPPGLTPAVDDCQIDPGAPPCPPVDACVDDPEDPDAPEDPRCPPVDEEPEAEPETEGYGGYALGVFGGHLGGGHHHHHHHRGVFRGGFGHYFWASGG